MKEHNSKARASIHMLILSIIVLAFALFCSGCAKVGENNQTLDSKESREDNKTEPSDNSELVTDKGGSLDSEESLTDSIENSGNEITGKTDDSIDNPKSDDSLKSEADILFKECGATYEVSGNTIVITGSGNLTGDVTIPETIDGKTVTAIADSAFSNEEKNNNITGLRIPSTVTSIGISAFYGCATLKSVYVDSADIEDWAFAACFELTSVTIGPNVRNIGEYAFGGCEELTDVTIESNQITKLAAGTFSECQSLKSITIPSSVTTIDVTAFGTASTYTNGPDGYDYGALELITNLEVVIKNSKGSVNVCSENNENVTGTDLEGYLNNADYGRYNVTVTYTN
ncbi:MAG: leucine-rich repeat domain-containing protein [Lachnotalea sp.]